MSDSKWCVCLYRFRSRRLQLVRLGKARRQRHIQGVSIQRRERPVSRRLLQRHLQQRGEVFYRALRIQVKSLNPQNCTIFLGWYGSSDPKSYMWITLASFSWYHCGCRARCRGSSRASCAMTCAWPVRGPERFSAMSANTTASRARQRTPRDVSGQCACVCGSECACVCISASDINLWQLVWFL